MTNYTRQGNQPFKPEHNHLGVQPIPMFQKLPDEKMIRTGDEPSEVIEALQYWVDTNEELVKGLKDGTLDYGASPEEMKALVDQLDVVRYWVYGDKT